MEARGFMPRTGLLPALNLAQSKARRRRPCHKRAPLLILMLSFSARKRHLVLHANNNNYDNIYPCESSQEGGKDDN